MFELKRKTSFPKVSRLLTFLGLVLLLVPQGVLAKSHEVLPAPTLVWPTDLSQTISEKPVIKGMTINRTSVEVYIDGKLNGMAKVREDESGTASFAYTPFLSLKVGEHTVSVRAVNKDTALVSKMSEISSFIIEEPYPAPTLFPPQVNDKTTSTRPFIVGLALNDSLIKVFIDHKLDGQFLVKNDESGTASFSYQPFLDLDPTKDHLVYATATNSNGKESAFSNIIGFLVEPAQPKVATESPEIVPASQADEAEKTSEENQKEEVKGEQTAVALEENSDSNENSNVNAASQDQDSTTLIWWVILIIVVVIVIVNLRGRRKKDTTGGLKGLDELRKKEDKTTGQKKQDSSPKADAPKAQKSGQETLFKKEGTIEGGRKMPPPPPSK